MRRTTDFLLAIAFLLLAASSGRAQFFLNGQAQVFNDSCYQLTDAVNWQSGSIWNGTKIRLDESFEVSLQVFLGCKDADGADGMVFGFQSQSTSVGSAGAGIGFGGVAPSIGIEIDTWQNLDLNDPVFDHIAIIANGNVSHVPNAGGTLAGPIQASANNPNIEDCQYHDLRVVWNASATRLQVFFDCVLRLTYTGDIVNTIFGGDPAVFWGFTSATGGSNNIHRVCFRYTSFLDRLEDVVVCPGGQVRLTATGGTSYQWTPVEGVSDPNAGSAIFAPEETTLYTVEIRDGCNYTFYDDVLVTVAGNPIFFDLGPDTTLCEGQALRLDVTTPTATYLWSDGRTSPFITVGEAGTYAVTVTRTDTLCIATDIINVSSVAPPMAQLGADTVLCHGQSLLLRVAPQPGMEYLWTGGGASDTLRVSSPGLYGVEVRNICGVATDAVQVGYEDCRRVYVPNVFSPNDDGTNDVFMPLHGRDVAEVHRFSIFDRWGGLVFESGGFVPGQRRFGWDGTGSGRPALAGIYVWMLDLTFRDGHRTQMHGEVVLMR